MGSLVSCGTIDKNIIFPIIPALTLFLYLYALRNGIIKINLIIFLCSSISKSLSFIPFLILKKRSKTNYAKDFSDKLVKQYKKARCQRFYFILLSAILDYIQFMIASYTKFDSNRWAFDILVINFVSSLLLKIKLYKHHYFCLIIIIISSVLLNIVDYIREEVDLINIFLNYIKELSICLSCCIDKYTMDKKYTFPYELCLYNGLFSLCIFLVTFGIFVLYDIKNLDDFIDYFCKISSIQLLYLFIFLICYFIFILCNCISIKIYSPNYIINIFIAQEIYHSFISHNKLKICLNITIAIIFIIIFLIFNEIIEINCFGLQKNTKRNIKKRVIMEAEDNNEINYDYNKDDNKIDNKDNNKDYNANVNGESLIEMDGFKIELENFKDIDDIGIENDNI